MQPRRKHLTAWALPSPLVQRRDEAARRDESARDETGSRAKGRASDSSGLPYSNEWRLIPPCVSFSSAPQSPALWHVRPAGCEAFAWDAALLYLPRMLPLIFYSVLGCVGAPEGSWRGGELDFMGGMGRLVRVLFLLVAGSCRLVYWELCQTNLIICIMCMRLCSSVCMCLFVRVHVC